MAGSKNSNCDLQKTICCSIDLTIGSRIIAFVGIAISVLLTTVLLNDKAASDYDVSRWTALAFGLDWRHIHPHTSTSHHLDPDGRMISILMIFYAIIFFVINVALMYATIATDRRFAAPWLFCEILGCVSKFGALIFHIATEYEDLSNVLITGSVIYIVVMIWWWTVVFLAQKSWIQRVSSIRSFSRYNEDISSMSVILPQDGQAGLVSMVTFIKNIITSLDKMLFIGRF